MLLCPLSGFNLTRKFLGIELRTREIAETPHEATIFLGEHIQMVQCRLGVHSKFRETMPLGSLIQQFDDAFVMMPVEEIFKCWDGALTQPEECRFSRCGAASRRQDRARQSVIGPWPSPDRTQQGGERARGWGKGGMTASCEFVAQHEWQVISPATCPHNRALQGSSCQIHCW